METRMRFACVLPHKGPSLDWTVMMIKSFIDDLGHSRVVMQSDQEPALMTLIANLRAKGLGIVPRNSPVGDSQANEMAERNVQPIEMQARTVKLAIEKRLGAKLPTSHALFAWLVSHSACLLNKYKMDEAGRTPYELWRERQFNGLMAEFGSKVFYMTPKTRGVSWTPGGILAFGWGKFATPQRTSFGMGRRSFIAGQ